MDIINQPKWFKRIVNCWFPFRGCGIRVQSVSNDFRTIEVRAALKWYSKTSIGWHFGGTLCAMVDPFYVFMLNKHFGHRFFVCDVDMKIDYLRAGKTKVTAALELSQVMIEEIEMQLQSKEKYHAVFHTNIIDANQQVVAKIMKTVLIAQNRKV